VTNVWLFAVLAAVLGAVLGFLAAQAVARRGVARAREEARRLREGAKKEAETLHKESLLSAKEEAYRLKEEMEEELRHRSNEVERRERKQRDREGDLVRKLDVVEKKEREVRTREQEVKSREKTVAARDTELHRLMDEAVARLERISGMTAAQAKDLLLSQMEQEARMEAGRIVRRIREEAELSAEKAARKVLTLAIERCAADHTAETTASVVHLPSDEMKGRIIGRDGRNIRAFEHATGVDVIIDDTPEAVILSAFDPVRREVARISMEQLVADGRIHPGRIEEVVAKVKKELDKRIIELGEQAVLDTGLRGMHPEMVKLVGRLHYRTSYGQNILKHSMEVAHLSGIIAAEIGLDQEIAKRGGFLHDIGKAMDHESEGTHVQIGAELATRYGEHPEVIHVIEGHHDDVELRSLYPAIVGAADAISGARPGARRESLESYVKRLKDLERLAVTFPGVESAYAIQAGREVRILVNPGKVTDDEAGDMAANISQKVEKELEYPGQVKVVVIREVRAVEYAK
jgi:ribonuclease Y